MMSLKTSVAVLAVLVLTGLVSAQTTYNVPTPTYPTIQSAINAASSGDTIMVGPGNFFEPTLSFGGKNLILKGAGSPFSWIDSANSGRCLVFMNGETSASRVEGFTFRNGRAPAGAVGTSGSPNGKVGSNGGAILITNASPTIKDCHFQMNNAGKGGDAFDVALGAEGATGGQGGDGGAIAVNGGSPTIMNCSFSGNFGGAGGAGKGKGFPSTMGLPGFGNGGPGGHGGAIAVIAGTPTISNCQFSTNAAGLGGAGSPSASLGGASGTGGLGGRGGAVHVKNGTATIVDSTFTSNTGGKGGSSPAAIGGTAGFGGKGGDGGAVNIDPLGTAILARLTFTSNAAGAGAKGGDSGAFFSVFGLAGRGGGGGLGGAICSAGILNGDRLTMTSNAAGAGGPGGEGFGVISGLGADGGHGGALAVIDGTNVVTNSTLWKNASGAGGNGGASGANNHNAAGTAGSGGAVISAVGVLDLANVVIYDNKLGAFGLGGFNYATPGAPGVAAGLVFASGTARVQNSIVYANLDGGGMNSSFFTLTSGLTVSYCDVQGGAAGTGNFDALPAFVDAMNGDFHLTGGSPCRDVGSTGVTVVPTLDFDGELRVICGAIDVGADEYLVLPAVPGQAPRGGIAGMDINNALNIQGCDVFSGDAGPYYAQATVGGPITFGFEGEPFQPVICMWHFLNVNNVNYGPFTGQFDIGGPLDASGIPTGLTVFADGSYTYPAQFAYTLDASGHTVHSYILPFFPSGVLCTFQSAIFRNGGIALTNAIEVTIP